MTTGQFIQLAILVALLSVPVAVCFGIKKRFQGIKAFALAVVIAAALMSGVVIAQWLGYDWYLDQQIAPLDRNGDGVWTPDEEVTWSKEDKRNRDAYFADGGRNVLTVIIFPAFSAVYSLAVAIIYWLIMVAKQRRIKHA